MNKNKKHRKKINNTIKGKKTYCRDMYGSYKQYCKNNKITLIVNRTKDEFKYWIDETKKYYQYEDNDTFVLLSYCKNIDN